MPAVGVLTATVLHVHHEGALVREAVRCAGVSSVSVDGVSSTGWMLAAGGFNVDHSRKLVLRAVEGPTVTFYTKVGV